MEEGRNPGSARIEHPVRPFCWSNILNTLSKFCLFSFFIQTYLFVGKFLYRTICYLPCVLPVTYDAHLRLGIVRAAPNHDARFDVKLPNFRREDNVTAAVIQVSSGGKLERWIMNCTEIYLLVYYI